MHIHFVSSNISLWQHFKQSVEVGRQDTVLTYLVEVFLFQEHDGFVNLQVVGQIYVLRVLHLIYTPVTHNSGKYLYDILSVDRKTHKKCWKEFLVFYT